MILWTGCRPETPEKFKVVKNRSKVGLGGLGEETGEK